ncbi:MAG: bifunctional UDP-N-acetylglucosamine diphosphorylase/glucosamine-1-phosphate N-acetyltransferase GlmU [Gammaproteobacteria bacterium]|nr:bifunctional UDP-N-acetylglucosamine diphosphorylase/glucosamine-1-phosphate N-acetyltransferase GlmU [Gammaproteobacteria bacterium]MDD9960382.1 bifunctional UDP-N-acetylglucosamine diphosphorylase/glucosamine-1-phosphate N-acetyltransferase GlmU [Gammaproteobacteria bacterium]
MEVVILAAGKGTRMFSALPKVLHAIGGKPMLQRVIATAIEINAKQIHVVVGFGADKIKAKLGNPGLGQTINWVMQEEQLGTGHAVQQAASFINSDDNDNTILVLYGDVPLIQASTLIRLLSLADKNSISLLTLATANNQGLGRIIRDENEDVVAIIEEKDATEEQRAITEVNSGIMAIPAARLADWLSRLDNANQQAEYYLTDIVAKAVQDGCKINALTIDAENEVQGVNDKTQLAQLERHLQMTNNSKLIEQGVTLRDPARVDVRGELNCGQDVEIDVNVIFEGAVTLGNNVSIGANVIIKDSSIGDGSEILANSNIDGAQIGNETAIGPSARIRPGTVLHNKVKIGNFVETKNAIIGNGSKANHLAYIGDAEIGENCNIGAGTIFCNYDGANKHKSTLGNNVFIGSNSVLVAPVSLADNAFVAAGSAINSDVPENHLAVGRGKQRNIKGWKRPTKNQN